MAKSLLEPYNQVLVSEKRDPIVPYLHKTIEELLIIPSARSVCPSVEELKKLPLVGCECVGSWKGDH